MKLAVSNIAWLASEERQVAAALRDANLRCIEIAPTRIAANPLVLRPSDIDHYKNFWRDHGIAIVAMQALLFGRPDLTVFETAEKRRATVDYLSVMIDIGAAMSADKLVFGSPRNRAIGELERERVEAIEREFFSDIGARAAGAGVTFCIEPNPVVYGCDYLNTSEEVVAMLHRVKARGLGLHLDAAAMTLSGEEPAQVGRLAGVTLEHFHISEPNLGAVGAPSVIDHAGFAASLRQINYDRIVSIEMRPGEAGDNVERLMRAIEFARTVYS